MSPKKKQKPRVNVNVGMPTIESQEPSEQQITLPPQTYQIDAQDPMMADVPLTSSIGEKQDFADTMLDKMMTLIAAKKASKAKAQRIAQGAASQMDPNASFEAYDRAKETYAEGPGYDTVDTPNGIFIIPHAGPRAGERIPMPPGSDASMIPALLRGPPRSPQTPYPDIPKR